MISTKLLLPLIVSFTVGTAAFAQTKTPSLDLKSAKAFAESEIARLEKAIAAEATKSDMVPCDFYELKVQLLYNQWFVEPKHYQELDAMSDKIDATITAINQKLSSLGNETVNVLVREGANAKTSEVPVAFKDLVAFFKLYDDRLKKCDKDQQAAMMKIMEEEPSANPMHIVLSQLRSAGGMMSVNLNASLTETDTQYELVMTPKTLGYDVELRVKVNANGVKQDYSFSLLDLEGSSYQVKLDEKAKWEIFSKGNVDGMPVDGLLRYRNFQQQFKGVCGDLTKIPSQRYGVPYVKYAEVPSILKNLKKQGFEPREEMEFVAIKPGTFQMGEGSREHTVTLTKGFEMQITEMTQSQWYAVMKYNPSKYNKRAYCRKTWSKELDAQGMCPNNPVDYVSWDEVQKFIQALNQKNDGYIYRLPTDAEWEYSAKAGSNHSFFFGDDEKSVKDVSWNKKNSGKHSHEVATAGNHGRGTANDFGLYDMVGNSWEWVQDWNGYLGITAQTDPMGPASGYNRLLRGGSAWHQPQDLRANLRYEDAYPSDAYSSTSFRLVRTPKQ